MVLACFSPENSGFARFDGEFEARGLLDQRAPTEHRSSLRLQTALSSASQPDLEPRLGQRLLKLRQNATKTARKRLQHARNRSKEMSNMPIVTVTEHLKWARE